jgi:hypothetical protein
MLFCTVNTQIIIIMQSISLERIPDYWHLSFIQHTWLAIFHMAMIWSLICRVPEWLSLINSDSEQVRVLHPWKKENTEKKKIYDDGDGEETEYRCLAKTHKATCPLQCETNHDTDPQLSLTTPCTAIQRQRSTCFDLYMPSSGAFCVPFVSHWVHTNPLIEMLSQHDWY